MVLQVLGSAKNPKKRRVLDIMGIPAMKIGDRRWWFLPSWNNLWVHPKHACASAPATNASEACDPTEASEINSTRWSSKMVMCFEIFQCAYWSWKWSPPGRWFFLVMVIGWAFGGWWLTQQTSLAQWNSCWKMFPKSVEGSTPVVQRLLKNSTGESMQWWWLSLIQSGGGNRLKTQKAQIQSDV